MNENNRNTVHFNAVTKKWEVHVFSCGVEEFDNVEDAEEFKAFVDGNADDVSDRAA
jgi:hypothetical protein